MSGLISIAKIPKMGTGAGARPAKAPPPQKAAGRPLVDLDRPVVFPQGPLSLRLSQKRGLGTGGPGEPPTVFTTDPHLSALEWVLYWSFAKYFNDPKDPRQPPFEGARDGSWLYQTPEGGQTRQVGSSVSDFIAFIHGTQIIVRLDTFHWHTEGSAEVQARDLFLTTHAAREGVIVRRIYDTQLMGDPTGAQAVRALADVLAGREIIAPVRSGLAEAPRETAWVTA